MLIRQRCESHVAHLVLCLGTQMAYKVQNRQIVECIKMELVLGIEY